MTTAQGSDERLAVVLFDFLPFHQSADPARPLGGTVVPYYSGNSGAAQTIKETTVTDDCRPVMDGFLIRAEWRRDFSSIPFFLTDTAGDLKTDQQTATLGVVWWRGARRAVWSPQKSS